MPSPPRTVRWTKKTDDLVHYVAGRASPALQTELGGWLHDRPRFASFVTTHQDKVRKKLTSAEDDQGRRDVRAELLIAYLILADRRFELAFEAYGARRLGPDLTATYRANQRLNLEVTRLRATADAAEEAMTGGGIARLANVVAGKLRQLPNDTANALVIVTHALPLDEEALNAAARLLKQRSDARDDEFFARRGLKTARDFYARYLQMSGVFVLDEGATPRQVAWWANREARHPPGRELLAALHASLR